MDTVKTVLYGTLQLGLTQTLLKFVIAIKTSFFFVFGQKGDGFQNFSNPLFVHL